MLRSSPERPAHCEVEKGRPVLPGAAFAWEGFLLVCWVCRDENKETKQIHSMGRKGKRERGESMREKEGETKRERERKRKSSVSADHIHTLKGKSMHNQ